MGLEQLQTLELIIDWIIGIMCAVVIVCLAYLFGSKAD